MLLGRVLAPPPGNYWEQCSKCVNAGVFTPNSVLSYWLQLCLRAVHAVWGDLAHEGRPTVLLLLLSVRPGLSPPCYSSVSATCFCCLNGGKNTTRPNMFARDFYQWTIIQILGLDQFLESSLASTRSTLTNHSSLEVESTSCSINHLLNSKI